MKPIALTALAAWLLVVPSARAVDLNGEWHIAASVVLPRTTPITQAGNRIDILNLQGNVMPGFPFSTYGVVLTVPNGGATITGRIMPSENLMDGRGVSVSTSGIAVDRFVFSRCSCNDDDTVDGDGCDAECRVEPCWTCSGDPSVCTPSPDGAACDDYDPCTSGETCSAGTCSGTPVPACIDMAGTWSRHRVLAGVGVQDLVTEVRQFDTDVVGSGFVGTMNPSTGAFDVRGVNFALFCPAFDTLTGTVAADGASYTATGFVGIVDPSAPDQCDTVAVTETGTRCIGPCPTTTSTSTVTTTTTSTTLPSGTVCQPVPMLDCRRPLQPRKAKLLIVDRALGLPDTITWKWTKGAATAVGAFGDPTTITDFAACLYDGDGTQRMTLRLPAGATWKPKSLKGFTYSDPELTPDGVSKATLLAGIDGKAKITLTGKGDPLPIPPLAALSLPVRVQLQGNGQCWEALFSDPDEHSAERFKASSD